MTQRKYTNRTYLDALSKKVLIFDGATGTSIQNQNLTAEHFGGEKYVGCNDYLVLTYPSAVEKVRITGSGPLNAEIVPARDSAFPSTSDSSAGSSRSAWERIWCDVR